MTTYDELSVAAGIGFSGTDSDQGWAAFRQETQHAIDRAKAERRRLARARKRTAMARFKERMDDLDKAFTTLGPTTEERATEYIPAADTRTPPLFRCIGAICATRPICDGWDRIETKRFPPGTVGATEYPNGVKWKAATVPFDWRPAWQ